MGTLVKPVTLDFVGILDLWPSVAAFCEATDTPENTVWAWRRRNRIPVQHWETIVAASDRAGYGVSVYSLLAANRIADARVDEERRRRREA